MIGAKHEAHRVRHEQADVTDTAADRNRQSGQERCGNVDDQADPGNVHTEVHGLFFSGEEQIQIRSSGVDNTGRDEEPDAEKPVDTFLQRGGEFAHHPEGKAAEAAGKRAHKKQDDGGKEGAGDDAAEEQSGAVNLSLTTPKKIDRGDGRGCAEKGSQRCEQRGEQRRKREMRLDDKRQDCPQ